MSKKQVRVYAAGASPLAVKALVAFGYARMFREVPSTWKSQAEFDAEAIAFAVQIIGAGC